eukprot:TRINITY_DN8259_c0_g1_i2.p1 TRINITY_DN8259_c0_g1~~TRINITY_DN8259_c0_g1_i2.p1  ORF type:complete len:152 (+),score=34.79 TRINITY_DN8259_c0_g1_i2:136-591(+)
MLTRLLLALAVVTAAAAVRHIKHGKECSASDMVEIESMKLKEPIYTSEDPGPWAGKERKHVPTVEYHDHHLYIHVPHPATEAHHITHIWAETDSGEVFTAHKFTHADEPRWVGGVPSKITHVHVFAKCNDHGLWKTEFEMNDGKEHINGGI